MPSERPRTPVTEARIEVWMWFLNGDTYRAFASQTFAAKAETVTDREWVSATLLGDDDSEPIEAVFRFTHTCRNYGAHESDSLRFFHATRRNAFILEGDAEMMFTELLSRKKLAA